MPRNGRQSKTLIRLSGVSVRLGGRATLDRVDVEVQEREIVTVIGPNGSGKTTLIRAALGLIEPDEGAVTRRAGLRIGYVPQHLGVDRALPLTVRRFLALSGNASRRDHETALGEVGVGYALDGPFQALSGGEAKRVTLARALLRRDGVAAREPAEAALERAATLIERSAARTLAPALCEWRAEFAAVTGDESLCAQLLREAQQGYEAVGASGHAARLEREHAS